MRALALVLAAILAVPLAADAQCPPYVKGRDSLAAFPLGDPSALPDGFILYRQGESTGLRRTSTRQYNPTIVPGTENDLPYSIEISDDGQWVLYLNRDSGALVVQRLDGTGRAALWLWGSRVAGFYRRSPYSTEAFYAASNTTLNAVSLDLSGNTARFIESSTRTILDVGGSRRSIDNNQYWSNSGFAVCADQILCREDGFDPYASYSGRTGFFTIPDGGRGTATPANLHPWLDDPLSSMWGCGHAMSHDGSLCLANTSLIGTACDSSAIGPSCLHDDSSLTGSACIPNRRAVALRGTTLQHYDHKGFSVFPFWRDSDPAVVIHDIVDRYGVSVNWAPPAYRRGEYDEVDFTSWNFSNDPRYVVGALRGSRLRNYGLPNALWVVNWVTNTWTRVTPDTLTLLVDDPAIHFTDLSSVNFRGRHMRPSDQRTRLLAPFSRPYGARDPTGRFGVALYALDGRRATPAAASFRSPAVLVAAPICSP